MLIRLVAICVILNFSFNVCTLISKEIFTPAKGYQLLESVVKLTDSLLEVTPYLNSSLSALHLNCVQILCKFVCLNGISNEIENDILLISQRNNYFCSRIEELRLYNYGFPDGKLSYGFLGNYSDKVDKLYLASANITYVESGAFAKGKFRQIYLENLQLTELKRDFFRGITPNFNTLSIIQKQMPLLSVHADFLCNVKYAIKSLTLQVGLQTVRNLTGGDCLLNNLARMDLSYNDFGKKMEETAFSEVSMIEWIDLSHSSLEYLPRYLFADFIKTLEFVDVSHNKLKTISRYIFGWREIPHDLKMYAEGNEWSCSCTLQSEMKLIKIHYKKTVVCSEPDLYKGWSVFDERICGKNSLEKNGTVDTTKKLTTINSEEDINVISTVTNEDDNFYVDSKTTESILNKTNVDESTPDYQLPKKLMKLDCFSTATNHNERISQLMRWPLIVFNLVPKEKLQVDVVVDSTEKPYSTFGLIWFNKVTSNYYKMEINNNEYGLGCYKNISLVTTVRDLKPNTAYTFCIVFKQQLTVSPFNCKSMQIRGNPVMENSAWLTGDMKIAALFLAVFGIILFLFGGILIIYLILKHKPMLIKDSKRVNRDDIVVLSKECTDRSIQQKEKELFRRSPFNFSQKRRKSNDSEVSYESYINPNLYEVIPAFEKLNTKSAIGLLTTAVCLDNVNHSDSDSCYLTPLESGLRFDNSVQYAELPYRAKRNSNDCLPELPADQPPCCLPLSELESKPEYAHIGNIYFLDSKL